MSIDRHLPSRVRLPGRAGAPSRKRRREDGSSPLRSARRWPSLLALSFVVGSIVALATVPVLTARRIDDVEERLDSVVEPSRRKAADLLYQQTRQMAALQAFLITGDTRFRTRYRAARAAEQAAQDTLTLLTDQMDPELRTRRVDVFNRSFQWHQHHADVIDEQVERAVFRQTSLSEEQELFEAAQDAVRGLLDLLAAEVEESYEQVDVAREQQQERTAVLGVLALLATLVLGVLARRIRSLAAETDERRLDALQTRREMDALLEGTGDGVVGMDLEGRCTFLNRAGAEMLGYPAQRALGEDVHGLMHHTRPDGTLWPREECPILAVLRDLRPAHLEDQILWRMDGSSFPVQIHVRPMMDGRRLTGAVLTFTDLTEIRRAQAALEQAIHARDEVVAVVSHDLRNPVGTVYTAAQLLLEVDLDEETRNEHLEIIQRSARRMNLLIQDLLDVARIEAGGMAVRTEVEEPVSMVDEAAILARPLAHREGLRVDVKAPFDVPRVRADRERVLQVFSNLVGNAVKFTPAGGTITLGAEARDGSVVLFVRDTGPGIAPEDQDHLFDRFWQVDRADRSGAGLGLAIVKGIVEAHGGRVWVESEPGEGATFLFTLPCTEREHEVADA